MDFIESGAPGQNQENNKDKYFKGQQSNEVFVCFMRHHSIYILKEFVYFLVFIIVVNMTLANLDIIKSVLQGNRELKMLFLAGFCIMTYFLHRFFIHLLNSFVNIGIITDQRFIDHQKTLFFKDTMDSVDMGQIQNIERVGDGVLPHLLGYGDLKIYLNASSAVMEYKCLPNINFHYRCLSRIKEARSQTLFDRGHSNIEVQQHETSHNEHQPIPFESVKK